MFNSIKMINKNVKGWKELMVSSFVKAANDRDHVEPVFNEVAGEGEAGGGSSGFSSPSLVQVVLAPYNFSFS